MQRSPDAPRAGCIPADMRAERLKDGVRSVHNLVSGQGAQAVEARHHHLRIRHVRAQRRQEQLRCWPHAHTVASEGDAVLLVLILRITLGQPLDNCTHCALQGGIAGVRARRSKQHVKNLFAPRPVRGGLAENPWGGP